MKIIFDDDSVLEANELVFDGYDGKDVIADGYRMFRLETVVAIES